MQQGETCRCGEPGRGLIAASDSWAVIGVALLLVEWSVEETVLARLGEVERRVKGGSVFLTTSATRN